MSKRGLAAAVLPFAAAVLAVGCGRDPGEPSFPRVAAAPPAPSQPAPASTPEPDAIHVPLRPRPVVGARDEQPLHVGGGVTEPFAIVRVLPDCRALVGAPQPVAVELVITREGAVQGARVLSAVPDGAKPLILESVRGWKFRPATLDGRPVSVTYTVAMNCA